MSVKTRRAVKHNTKQDTKETETQSVKVDSKNTGKISVNIDFEATLLPDNKLPILDETRELIKQEIINYMPYSEFIVEDLVEKLIKRYPECKGKNINVIIRYGIDVPYELSNYVPYVEGKAYCADDPSKKEIDITRGSVRGLRNKSLKTHLQYAIMLFQEKKMVESLNELLDLCREEKK
jgi:hypothetical protein